MGSHEARTWLREKGRIANFFGNRGFIRLNSSETNPLLGSDCYSANQQHDGDIEDIIKRNYKLQEKLDEAGRTLDEMRRTTEELKREVDNAKNERHGTTEAENMKKTVATLKAEIRKTTNRIAVLEEKIVNKNKDTEKIAEIEIRNAKLEEEITKLKKRFIYLEVNSIQNPTVEYTSSAPLSSLDQIEEMERPASYDELFAWISILTFFVGFLLVTQI